MKPIFFVTAICPTLICAALLGGCGGSGKGPGSDSDASNASVAARTSVVPAGDAECPFGGILVESGIDENGNGMLGDNEVDSSEKVCNGPDGFDSLLDINPEPPGPNCRFGGLRVDAGVDNNRDGSLAAGEITRSEFVCAPDGVSEWQAATLIENLDSGNAIDPQIAVDVNGNAVAVWVQDDGSRLNIRANRYVAGVGWGDALLIESDDSGHAGEPQVALDGSGNAIAVWSQDDGMRTNIWANRYVVGTGWGNAGLIETDDTGDADNPRIAVEPGGNAFVIWRQFDGMRYNAQASRYIVGPGWQTAEPVEDDDSGDIGDPRIAVDGAGNAFAVWIQSAGPVPNIHANRYITGMGWDTETLISTDNTDGVFAPRIAADSNGNALALWVQFEALSLRSTVRSNRYDAGLDWAGPLFIDRVGSTESGEPEVAFDSVGNAVVAWRMYGSSDGILANRYLVGQGWDGARGVVITDTETGDARVAVLEGGNAIVVWDQFDGLRRNLHAIAYQDGMGWDNDSEIIESNNLGSAMLPSLGHNPSGDVFAVWYQSDGANTNIWSNHRVGP